MNKIQHKLFEGKDLTQSESTEIFSQLITGQLSDVEMTSLLVCLKLKKEQPEEIAGAAMALRENAIKLPSTQYQTADSCGTGGSGMNTVNISTMVAFVLAEIGLPMVKHGNRSISSKCGSADVLEQLGVSIDMNEVDAKNCLDNTNFCFLFAPYYHPGVGNVMPIRKQLKTRTIFNLLGPLINPASPEFQLMGVYSPELCLPAAKTLQLAGCKAAMVVHSQGYDEITLHSPTTVVELEAGKLNSYTIDHNDFGLPKCNETDIAGNSPKENSEFFVNLLKGNLTTSKLEAIANTVAANAGALLKVSGLSKTLIEGTQQALAVINSGKAYDRLNKVVGFSRQLKTKAQNEQESKTNE